MSDVQNTPVNRNCLACAFPFWDQLTPEEQAQLCRFTRPVRYRKGERVHSPVENCVGILLLRSGQLRAYLLSEDGRDITLYRLFPGEVCILSASCVMDSVNFDLYIDAEEDTEAYCIGAGVFRQLMQQNLHVRCYAYQMTAERFSDTMWTMQQILFMSADRRLAIFLTDELAKTRWHGCPHDPRPDRPLHGLRPRGRQPPAEILCRGGPCPPLPRQRHRTGQRTAEAARQRRIKRIKKDVSSCDETSFFIVHDLSSCSRILLPRR